MMIEHARLSGDTELMEKAYSRMIQIHERTGSYKNALKYMKTYLALKDSMIAMERSVQKEQMQARLQAEEKEKEIEMLEKDSKLKELALQNLQVESDKKAKENQLLEKENALIESRLRRQQLEKERTRQALMLTEEQLNAEKRNLEIKELEKNKKLQELLLRQKETEDRERQREIELLAKEKDLQDAMIQDADQKRFFLYVVLGLTSAVLGLSVVGFVQNRRKNQFLSKKNDEILTQKNEIEQHRDKINQAKSEIEAAYDNIQVLSEFGQKITSTLDFESINWTTYAYVNSLMDAAVFGIGLYRQEQNAIDYISFLENGVSVPHFGFKMNVKNSLSVLCYKSQEEIIINDYDQEINHYLKEEPYFRTQDRPKSLVYMPLIADKPIGVLTVQSTEKKAFEKNEINLLRTLASYVTISLSNAEAYKVINTKNKHITDSIRYAQTIQRSILPSPSRFQRGMLENFVLFKPKDIVSGDFYWYSRISGEDLMRDKLPQKDVESLIFLAAIDCTGHGVPGGFMSMIGNTLLNEIVNQKHIYDPAEILKRLNEGVVKALRQEDKTNDDGMDLCLIMIERTTSKYDRVTFSGAKRPLYYIPNNESRLRELKGDNKSIGGVHNRKSSKSEFSNQQLKLDNGSVLYLTTDGLQDQNNPEGKKFGKVQLLHLLEKNYSQPMLEQKTALENALVAHQQTAFQRDDITVIGIKI